MRCVCIERQRTAVCESIRSVTERSITFLRNNFSGDRVDGGRSSSTAAPDMVFTLHGLRGASGLMSNAKAPRAKCVYMWGPPTNSSRPSSLKFVYKEEVDTTASAVYMDHCCDFKKGRK